MSGDRSAGVLRIRDGLTLAVALGLSLPMMAYAQRRSPQGAAKPKVDIVAGVGCVERRADNPPTWWLSHAADPTVTPSGSFSTNEIEQVKTIPLGTNTIQLIGVSDFLNADGLLQDPTRAQFTSRETVNATGQLREGRKVVVKGPLVDVGGQKRINLMAVVALAETCG